MSVRRVKVALRYFWLNDSFFSKRIFSSLGPPLEVYYGDSIIFEREIVGCKIIGRNLLY